MNVGRSPRVVVISPRISARPDRNKSEVAVLIRERVTTAFEIGVQRRIVLIHVMPVAARGISLPDFDQRVRSRSSVFIQHPPADDDALAKWFAMVLSSEGTGLHVDWGRIETRPRHFRKSGREIHQRFGRP